MSITQTSNCLGKKVVDECDLIVEFGVGRNFGVQDLYKCKVLPLLMINVFTNCEL